MNDIKVSVLIPVYNGAPFIERAIKSILQQTYSNFELILLNDASTDNSETIISRFSDSRIKYHKNQNNLGISASRNKLMDLAQGEYLAVMDNDDLSMPQRLAQQVEFLDNHQDVAMLGSWGELFCQTPPSGLFGKLKQQFINLGWVWCQPPFPDLHNTLQGNPVMHSSSMLRKSALLEHNIRYNPKYTPAEDYDLCRQILEAGLKLANIQNVLFKYHYHGQNFSLTNKDAMCKADHKVKTDIRKLLTSNQPDYPYYRTMIHKLRLKFFLKDYHD